MEMLRTLEPGMDLGAMRQSSAPRSMVTTSQVAAPVPNMHNDLSGISTTSPRKDLIVQIAAGDCHNLIVMSSGRMLTFGHNN